MSANNAEIHIERHDVGGRDLTVPFYESETFDSIWQALRWKQVRSRIPKCLKKTLRSRYMLANLVYLGYAIGILIIDFNSAVNGSSADASEDLCDNTTTTVSGLDQPVGNTPLVNHLFIGKEMSKIESNVHLKNIGMLALFF